MFGSRKSACEYRFPKQKKKKMFSKKPVFPNGESTNRTRYVSPNMRVGESENSFDKKNFEKVLKLLNFVG